MPTHLTGDYVHQPFEPELDWGSFSLSVPQSDIPRLHEVLEGVPEKRFEAMQARCTGY